MQGLQSGWLFDPDSLKPLVGNQVSKQALNVHHSLSALSLAVLWIGTLIWIERKDNKMMLDGHGLTQGPSVAADRHLLKPSCAVACSAHLSKA